MTINEVRLDWIKEINNNLAKHNVVVKETSIMKVYDAAKERGMDKKLWLCGECEDGKDRYFYMYITKKHELKKYFGSVYANVKSDFEEDTANYVYLGKVC